MSTDRNQGRAKPAATDPPAAQPGAAPPPPSPSDGGAPPAPDPTDDQQRAEDHPQPPEPLSLDNPDDYTFGASDQPIPPDAPGIPMDQWNPEIVGDPADFVPDEDDQPIQYAEPGADPAREQIRQTILARRGDMTTGTGG